VKCQFSVEKVKGQKPRKIAAHLAYMFTYGRRLQTRPNQLLSLIYCRRLRRSATGRTAAYHVGTFLVKLPTADQRNSRADLVVVSNEYGLSVVALPVKNTECAVRRAADNVAFVRLGRQTDGRYLAVVTHFR